LWIIFIAYSPARCTRKESLLNVDTGISAASQEIPNHIRTIDFGAGGNGAEVVRGGWSAPEPGFRWMTGVESELQLDQRFVDGGYFIELDLIPFVRPPGLPSQRLTVCVNGTVVGQSTVAASGRFGYRIPAAALSGRDSTSILLSHPDAARPCDFGQSTDVRSLSVSLRQLRVSRIADGVSGAHRDGTGGIALAELERIVNMSPARFILNFESLGDNCEFGVLQRLCGAESFLSLLRFAGMELPTLLGALDAGLQDFGVDANVEISLDDKPRPEYVVREKRYGAYFHTFRYQGETDPEQLRASESKRLIYCARKFVGDLKRGNRIFVIKRNVALQEEEILPLYAALSRYGRNVLLWMVPAEEGHASGSVQGVAPGLFKGYIDRFAPHEDAYDLSLSGWLDACVNAYQLALADGLISRTAMSEVP
jgi:hypothetical protein